MELLVELEREARCLERDGYALAPAVMRRAADRIRQLMEERGELPARRASAAEAGTAAKG